MKSFWPVLFIGSFLLSLTLMGCGGGTALVEQKCTQCHSMDGNYVQQRTAAEWQRIVTAMKAMGMEVTGAEEKTIVKALYAEYGR
jgi:hypothetical protein